MSKPSYLNLAKQKGFAAFLATQFLGALNDNLLKWVIILLVTAGMVRGGSAEPAANLNWINALFILPSLLFTSLAGWMADNFEKRRVLITTKAFEIGIMGLGWLALRSGSFQAQLGVLFLLATQFTFFGPSKYGVVPELVRDEELSRANGLLEMSTFLAILLGSVVSGPLFERYKLDLDVIAGVLIAVAALGSLLSLGIGRSRVPESRGPFRLRLLWSEVVEGTRVMRADRRLWLTNLGVAYFWFQGALFQLAVVLLGKETLHLSEGAITHLGVSLAIGIGTGSMLAGRWSGQKVELGLVPLGSLGMGLASLLLAFSARSHPALVPWALALVGAAAGLFAVPLNALLQQKADAGAKGRIQAAANFYSTLGIILAGVVLLTLSAKAGLSPERIILVAGLGCFLMTAYLVLLLPEFLVRFTLWLAAHTVYRIRIEGQENVPHNGPALLVCNHTALTDGLLVQACIQRFVRFMVYKPIYQAQSLHWLFKAGNAIPISARRGDVEAALERAQAEIRAGHVVCIFAEGAITRTGNLLKFKRGLEKIMQGLDAPIIPVHLDGLWGSIFSFRGGRFTWKAPERLPYPVTVTFGKPLPADTKAETLRGIVQEMGAEALGRRLDGQRLEERFIRSAKRHYLGLAVADSSGASLGHGRALGASLALARWMRANVKGERVGVLLPPSAAGALANLAGPLCGKATVNLNFTAGEDFVSDCVQQCSLDAILTSRVFVEKAGLQARPQMAYLEDLFTPSFKAEALAWSLAGLLLPTRLLVRLVRPAGAGATDDLATIIFSSGSTGVPKGVMLTHRNILANLEGLAQVLQVGPKDRMLGSLPLFHSFGYTCSVWLPLDCGFAAVYHPNPLDAAMIGRLAGKHRATLIFTTPTFAQHYVRKCTPEQFRHLRYAAVGAEKLREPVARAFKEKFGLDLLEGYGCTEMAPVVSFNVPDVDEGGEHHVGFKSGTVGAPVPGVAAKVVDIDSGEPVEPGRGGLLLVKGPSRMAGYWQREDLTKSALRDGWYVTGDVAVIDVDGFIQLTDRLSRFSKIGGEMVPHLKVEEAAQAVLGEDTQCVVCSIPDEGKGERLVLLHTDPAREAEDLWNGLAAAGLPKLWVPKKDSIFRVENVPTLGTGKTDLRRSKELALALASAAPARPEA